MQITNVVLDKIVGKDNSRMDMNGEDLSLLMQSIKDVGLLQPIAIQETAGDKHHIVFGNRRFLAYKKLKEKTIPAVVYPESMDKQEVRRIHLIENLIRRDLSPFEEGREYSAQMKNGSSAAEVAVWLNIPKHRVLAAIRHFKDTPTEFENLVVRSSPGTRTKRGKIPMSLSKKINSSRRKFNFTKAQEKVLYKAASEFPSEMAKSFNQIAAQVFRGEEIDFTQSNNLTSFAMTIAVTKKEFARIEKKYIKTKLNKSISSVARDILNGSLEETINCSSRER